MDFLNHKGLEKRWEPKWVPNPWFLLPHCYALARFMGASPINILSILKKWLVLTKTFYKAMQCARKSTKRMVGDQNSNYPDNYLREMTSFTEPHRVFTFIICNMKAVNADSTVRPRQAQAKKMTVEQHHSECSNIGESSWIHESLYSTEYSIGHQEKAYWSWRSQILHN